MHRDHHMLLGEVTHETGYVSGWGTQEEITEYRRGNSLRDEEHYGRLEMPLR